MTELYKVCLDIEGNDKGLAITTVAAESEPDAILKAKAHVGSMNQNYRNRQIDVIWVKKVGKKGCITDGYIPRT